jgi:hypothetical protein
MRIPLLALAALGLAAAPAAAKTTYERFTVTFEAHQDTTWSQPKHNYLTDCYHQYFHAARGEERWTIRSRQPTRVLVVVSEPMASFRIGTWDPTEIVRQAHVRLSNVVERERSEAHWSEPGRCGGTREDRALPRDDCGRRMPGLLMTFAILMDGKFRFQIGGDPPVAGPMFTNCQMLYPEGLHDGVLRDPSIPGKLNEFRDRRRKQVKLSWGRTFQTDAPAGARPSTTRTDAGWTFTFTRAADKDAKPTTGRRSRPGRKGKPSRRGRRPVRARGR